MTAQEDVRQAALAELERICANYGIDLPLQRVILVGGQGQGKSALSDALLGERANVVLQGIGTRRPLHIQCEPANVPAPQWALFDNVAQTMSTVEARNYIARQTQDVEGGVGVSSTPIRLMYRSRDCRRLSFVDLPGLVAQDLEVAGRRQAIEDMVRAELNLHPENTIIVVVISSESEGRDLALCNSLGFVRNAPRWQERTIVCFSQLDRLLSNTQSGSKPSMDLFFGHHEMFFQQTPRVQRFYASPRPGGDGMTHVPVATSVATAEAEDRRILQSQGHPTGLLANVGFSAFVAALQRKVDDRFEASLPSVMANLEQIGAQLSSREQEIGELLQSIGDVQTITRNVWVHSVRLIDLLLGGNVFGLEQFGRTLQTELDAIPEGDRLLNNQDHISLVPFYDRRLVAGLSYTRVCNTLEVALRLVGADVPSTEEILEVRGRLSDQFGSSTWDQVVEYLVRQRATRLQTAELLRRFHVMLVRHFAYLTDIALNQMQVPATMPPFYRSLVREAGIQAFVSQKLRVWLEQQLAKVSALSTELVQASAALAVRRANPFGAGVYTYMPHNLEPGTLSLEERKRLQIEMQPAVDSELAAKYGGKSQAIDDINILDDVRVAIWNHFSRIRGVFTSVLMIQLDAMVLNPLFFDLLNNMMFTAGDLAAVSAVLASRGINRVDLQVELEGCRRRLQGVELARQVIRRLVH